MLRKFRLCAALILVFVAAGRVVGQVAPSVTSESLAVQRAGASRSLTLSNELRAGSENLARTEISLIGCPPGTFTMGTPGAPENGGFENERPVEVKLTDSFWITRTEITQKQFEIVTGKTPWVERGETGFFKVGDDYPAVCISIREAYDFCVAVTQLERSQGRLPEDWEYTLPTEAQWEYAARAGTTTAYSFGDEVRQLAEYGWANTNAPPLEEPYAHPVGMKRPNPWGIYDMHGNVWEWTLDMYSEDVPGGNFHQGGINPKKYIENGGDAVYRFIVLRGGSWGNQEEASRSATRYPHEGRDAIEDIGFRMVLCKPVYNRAPERVLQREVANSVGMDLKLIPGGNFTMGSPEAETYREADEPVTQVTIDAAFYMGRTEVTQGQYARVMGGNPSAFQGEQIGNLDSSSFPVERVSWEDATEFCKRLSSLPGEQAAGRVYRLPTEAEWEYACRSESYEAYWFGSSEESLLSYAWIRANSGDTTHPVRQKEPNYFGLSNMHGNVSEWCSDWYGDYPQESPVDPKGPSQGTFRIYRGGSWGSDPADSRSANRHAESPTHKIAFIGFRVVMTYATP